MNKQEFWSGWFMGWFMGWVTGMAVANFIWITRL